MNEHVILEDETVKDFAKIDWCGDEEYVLDLHDLPSYYLVVASWLSLLVNSSSFGYRNLFSFLFDYISGPSTVSYRQQ